MEHAFGPLALRVRPARERGWLAVSVDGPLGRADFKVRDLGLSGAGAARAVVEALGEAFARPDTFHRLSLGAPMPGDRARAAFLREGGALLAAARKVGPAALEAARVAAAKGGSVDLKRALMDLGNRLVAERGFDPSGPVPPDLDQALAADHTTDPITMFTQWLNLHPEAAEILAGMGIEWRMPR